MDLSCIISSGDLELYILGLLPEEEAYQVEQLSLLFPEVREELDRISITLEALSSTSLAAPSAGVKDALMQRLSLLKESESPSSLQAPPVMEREQKRTAPVVTMDPGRARPAAWMRAAAIIGLVVLAGAAFFFTRQDHQRQRELAQVQTRVDSLQRRTLAQEQALAATSRALQLWQDPQVRKLNLTSVPGKPEALAQVFWNRGTNEVYVSNLSLPPAPSGRQYQLWAIVNGQPVDAGMLSDEREAIQKMKQFASADAFAITLEKQGGSPQPTMEELYVMAPVS